MRVNAGKTEILTLTRISARRGLWRCSEDQRCWSVRVILSRPLTGICPFLAEPLHGRFCALFDKMLLCTKVKGISHSHSAGSLGSVGVYLTEQTIAIWCCCEWAQPHSQGDAPCRIRSTDGLQMPLCGQDLPAHGGGLRAKEWITLLAVL